MKNRNLFFVATILSGAIMGFVFGYLIFGKIAGQQLSVQVLFSGNGGALRSFANDVTGISVIRRNILLTGLAGAVIGAVEGVFLSRNSGKKKRR